MLRSDQLLRRTFFGFLVSALMIPLIAWAQVEQLELEKPRIALIEPQIDEGISDSGRKLLSKRMGVLFEEIERSILATRKFIVITRDKSELEAILNEQAFANSGVSSGNAAESGQIEAVDYLVTPVITDFVFYRSATPVPNISNKYFRRDSGRIEIHSDILDTRTAQKMDTFYLKSSFASGKKVVNTRSGIPSASYFTRMSKEIAGQLSDKLINTVFPMVVLKMENNQVWLNRGEDGGLKKGDILEVFRPNDELIDPYTGEKLGFAEVEPRKIKVLRINPKTTVAEIVVDKDGGTPVVEPGYIVRKP